MILYQLRRILELLETMNKKLLRCSVCNDIHLGTKGPEICPTCGAKNAFVVVDRDEALKVIGDQGGKIQTVEELVAVWSDFTEGKDFKLADDREMIETLAQGELENQKNRGLKYCPCRITTGDFEKDLRLICPCNFFIQKTWKDYGECWCGLFVKR
jgi:ferredoxin-thioredoxin reductase catalytic chain